MVLLFLTRLSWKSGSIKLESYVGNSFDDAVLTTLMVKPFISFLGQGFLPVEASILEVEVWGFGGKAAKEKQDVYKKRENLFSEQRRKVEHCIASGCVNQEDKKFN